MSEHEQQEPQGWVVRVEGLSGLRAGEVIALTDEREKSDK